MNTDTLVKCVRICSKRRSGETQFATSTTQHLQTNLNWWISLGAIPQWNSDTDTVTQIAVLIDDQGNVIYLVRDNSSAYVTSSLGPEHTLMMLQAT